MSLFDKFISKSVESTKPRDEDGNIIKPTKEEKLANLIVEVKDVKSMIDNLSRDTTNEKLFSAARKEIHKIVDNGGTKGLTKAKQLHFLNNVQSSEQLIKYFYNYILHSSGYAALANKK